MRNIEISDELYESLKGFVVDPFDDTAEIVVGRLVEIANKAKNRWSAMEGGEQRVRRPSPMAERMRICNQDPKCAAESSVVL